MNLISKKWMATLSLALFAFCLSQTSQAAGDTKKVWLKLQAGIDKADKTTFTAFGGGLGVFLGQSFGLGAYYLTSSSKSKAASGITVNEKNSLMGGELLFFVGESRFLNMGLKTGISKYDGTVQVLGVTVSGSSSDLYVGPTLGLDIRLGGFFSLGAEGSFLRVFHTTGYNVILGLGTVKFFF